MQVQLCDLLEKLDTDAMLEPVQDYLAQAFLACQSGHHSLMKELAETARQIALQANHPPSEAAALLYLGAVYAQTAQLDQATKLFERARRFYYREPAQRTRHNEAIALYNLGLVYQEQVKNVPTSAQRLRYHAQAITCYQRAQALLAQAKRAFAAIGDNEQAKNAQTIQDEISRQIDSQALIVYMDDQEYRLLPSGAHPQTPGRSSAAPNYQTLSVDQQQSLVSGLAPGEYILIPWVKQEQAASQDAEEFEIGAFERDDQGNVRPTNDQAQTSFVQPGE